VGPRRGSAKLHSWVRIPPRRLPGFPRFKIQLELSFPSLFPASRFGTMWEQLTGEESSSSRLSDCNAHVYPESHACRSSAWVPDRSVPPTACCADLLAGYGAADVVQPEDECGRQVLMPRPTTRSGPLGLCRRPSTTPNQKRVSRRYSRGCRSAQLVRGRVSPSSFHFWRRNLFAMRIQEYAVSCFGPRIWDGANTTPPLALYAVEPGPVETDSETRMGPAIRKSTPILPQAVCANNSPTLSPNPVRAREYDHRPIRFPELCEPSFRRFFPLSLSALLHRSQRAESVNPLPRQSLAEPKWGRLHPHSPRGNPGENSPFHNITKGPPFFQKTFIAFFL